MGHTKDSFWVALDNLPETESQSLSDTSHWRWLAKGPYLKSFVYNQFPGTATYHRLSLSPLRLLIEVSPDLVTRPVTDVRGY